MAEDDEAGTLDLERAEMLAGVVDGLCLEAGATLLDEPSLTSSEPVSELIRAGAVARGIVEGLREERALMEDGGGQC